MLRLVLIFARRSALFIKVGVAYVYQLRYSYLKEDIALPIDNQSVYHFLLHYPTRGMQIRTFSYMNNFSYPNVSNREVQRCSDNRGSTVYLDCTYNVQLKFIIDSSCNLINALC